MPTDIAKGPADGFLEIAYILDSKYETLDVLDTFESFYWNDRYNRYGDFEIVMPILPEHLPALRINNYLSIRESDRLMIIEQVTTKTDPTQGDMLVISGRSLESILTRRILWGVFQQSGPVQNIIISMITQNAISPSIENRKIPGLSVEWSTDEAVTTPTEDVKSIGDGLYEMVAGLASSHNLGFKMVPEGEGGFKFSMYVGEDRSWAQEKNIPVIFSHSYENLLESNYIQTEVDYVSNAFVRGDEDDVSMEVLRKPERTGMARREMFVDTGLQPETQEVTVPVLDDEGNPTYDDDGNPITEKKTIKIYDAAYYNQMLVLAKIEMAKHMVTEAFDSTVDTTHQFFYGVDYNVGDIVQVENRYGFEGRCRITEVMRSRDANGPKLVPTFIMVDEKGNEVTTN